MELLPCRRLRLLYQKRRLSLRHDDSGPGIFSGNMNWTRHQHHHRAYSLDFSDLTFI